MKKIKFFKKTFVYLAAGAFLTLSLGINFFSTAEAALAECTAGGYPFYYLRLVGAKDVRPGSHTLEARLYKVGKYRSVYNNVGCLDRVTDVSANSVFVFSIDKPAPWTVSSAGQDVTITTPQGDDVYDSVSVTVQANFSGGGVNPSTTYTLTVIGTKSSANYLSSPTQSSYTPDSSQVSTYPGFEFTPSTPVFSGGASNYMANKYRVRKIEKVNGFYTYPPVYVVENGSYVYEDYVSSSQPEAPCRNKETGHAWQYNGSILEEVAGSSPTKFKVKADSPLTNQSSLNYVVYYDTPTGTTLTNDPNRVGIMPKVIRQNRDGSTVEYYDSEMKQYVCDYTNGGSISRHVTDVAVEPAYLEFFNASLDDSAPGVFSGNSTTIGSLTVRTASVNKQGTSPQASDQFTGLRLKAPEATFRNAFGDPISDSAVTKNLSAYLLSLNDGTTGYNAWSTDGTVIGAGQLEGDKSYFVRASAVSLGLGSISFVPEVGNIKWLRPVAGGGYEPVNAVFPGLKVRVAVFDVGTTTVPAASSVCSSSSPKAGQYVTFNYTVKTPGFGEEVVNRAFLNLDANRPGEEVINTLVLLLGNKRDYSQDSIIVPAQDRINIPEWMNINDEKRVVSSNESNPYSDNPALYNPNAEEKKGVVINAVRDFDSSSFTPVNDVAKDYTDSNGATLFKVERDSPYKWWIKWINKALKTRDEYGYVANKASTRMNVPSFDSPSDKAFLWNKISVETKKQVDGLSFPSVSYKNLTCVQGPAKLTVYGDVYSRTGISGSGILFVPVADGVSVISTRAKATTKSGDPVTVENPNRDLKVLPIYSFDSKDISTTKEPSKTLAKSITMARILKELNVSDERKLIESKTDTSLNANEQTVYCGTGSNLCSRYIDKTFISSGSSHYEESVDSGGKVKFVKLKGGALFSLNLSLNPPRKDPTLLNSKLFTPIMESAYANADHISDYSGTHKYDFTNPDGRIWVVDSGLEIGNLNFSGNGAIIAKGPIKITGDIKPVSPAPGGAPASLALISLSQDLIGHNLNQESTGIDIVNAPANTAGMATRTRAISLNGARQVDAFLFAPYGTITTGDTPDTGNPTLTVNGAMVASKFEFARPYGMVIKYDSEAASTIPKVLAKLFEQRIINK